MGKTHMNDDYHREVGAISRGDLSPEHLETELNDMNNVAEALGLEVMYRPSDAFFVFVDYNRRHD